MSLLACCSGRSNPYLDRFQRLFAFKQPGYNHHNIVLALLQTLVTYLIWSVMKFCSWKLATSILIVALIGQALVRAFSRRQLPLTNYSKTK